MADDQNPYSPPRESCSGASLPTNRQQVKKRLLLPGILMVIGGVAMTLYSAPFAFFYLITALRVSNQSPNSYRHFSQVGIALGVVMLGSLFCIYGGIQLLRTRQFGVCVASAFAISFPFTSPYLC